MRWSDWLVCWSLCGCVDNGSSRPPGGHGRHPDPWSRVSGHENGHEAGSGYILESTQTGQVLYEAGDDDKEGLRASPGLQRREPG